MAETSEQCQTTKSNAYIPKMFADFKLMAVEWYGISFHSALALAPYPSVRVVARIGVACIANYKTCHTLKILSLPSLALCSCVRVSLLFATHFKLSKTMMMMTSGDEMPHQHTCDMKRLVKWSRRNEDGDYTKTSTVLANAKPIVVMLMIMSSVSQTI